MTALPPVADLVNTGISKGTFKAALTSLRAHLYELLGGTGTQPAALAALGAPLHGRVDKVGAYTVVAADRGKVISCSGTWTLSVTDAATLGDGFVFAVLNAGSGTITIDPYLSQTIDGAATKAVSPNGMLLLYCNGTALSTVGGLDATSIATALGYTPASTTALAARVSIDHGHGNIGSFVFAASTYLPLAAGSTESGSRLHIAGLRSDASAGAAALYVSSAGTLSGTWRCLGYCVSPSSGATATLWQRIS